MPRRQAAWTRLAAELDRARLAAMTTEIGLDAAIGAAADVLAGKVRGRLVVDVNR
jgi:acrylyl-CoA reductase (NADPH)